MLSSIEDFEEKYKAYSKMNNSFEKTLIFRVGEEAGLFSELNNMLIAMCWCYLHKVKFCLYADDANFTGGNGWNEIFTSFCSENHDWLNRYGNYRHKSHFRFKRILLPNLFFKSIVFPYIIKKRNNVDYLTQDIFSVLVSNEFLKENIVWELFGMNGRVEDEFVKLRDFALNYAPDIKDSIVKNIENLSLPKEYISMQIRGGDKRAEYEFLYDVNYCIEMIRKSNIHCNSIFVFTDDYRNVSKINEEMEIDVYTLTRCEERGYYNEEFNLKPWKERKRDIVKVFSMVEICMMSTIHFGYTGACTNDFISKVLPRERYIDMRTSGSLKRKNFKYYVQKMFKFR